ncbi:MAG: type VI secretion system-associated protein TagF [Hyphomicrobiales bacterium]|nr:type VI secretion system-associated protein TagF [Hyphomicrobiales bacterium]MBV8664199.1 type VI secretion system-associated protein TagF [Hyphomicrobiales bacterium]
MSETAPRGGLYGKAPAFGDFVVRRLPSTFVRPWDDWLSRSLAASRQQIGEGWTHAYLSSPPWRFALDPGLAGETGWIGVLVSSIDQFRRCYPITLAIPLPAETRLDDLSGVLDPVVADLEATALQLIGGEIGADEAAERIEAASRTLAPNLRRGSRFILAGLGRVRTGGRYASLASMTAELGADSDEFKPPMSAWWHEHWSSAPAANLVCAGLPAPEIFASLLDGVWRERGWSEETAR